MNSRFVEMKSRIADMYDRANVFFLRFVVGSGAFAVSGMARAQGGDPTQGMIRAICGLVAPLVGPNSQVLSLVFLIALAVMIFLWWMSENKEGVLTWVLRAGIALGILINIFTLPKFVGLPIISCPNLP